MEYFDDPKWIEEKFGQKYCNSGGADGADSIFEEECIKNEIPVIAWSFPGHKTKSKNVKILTKEELDEGWEHVKIANESLKRNIYNLSPYVRNLLARNWFQVKNILNGNGRIYQDNENLRKSIEDFNNKGTNFGQIGYPETFETYMGNISHTVKNVRIEEDKVVGDIKFTNTINGKTLKNLFEQDNPGIVFRPRAAGTTNPDGSVTIREIFSYDAINESDDSFGSACLASSRYNKKQIGVNPIQGRIVSDLDPYGEENWDI